MAGENETVDKTFGGGVGGGCDWEGDAKDKDDDGSLGKEESSRVLGLGAKKREITCCFCFPMATAPSKLPAGVCGVEQVGVRFLAVWSAGEIVYHVLYGCLAASVQDP